MTIEYEYFTKFSFPNSINKENNYNERFDINDTAYYTVKDDESKNSCTFTIFTKCCTDDPQNHNPIEDEKYVHELQYVYKIICASIEYHTGHIIKSRSTEIKNANMEDYYNLPEINNNFYEVAEENGFKFDVKKRKMSFIMSAALFHPLTSDKMILLHTMIKEVNNDGSKMKFNVIDHYFRGVIDEINPFVHWFMICEYATRRNIINKKEDKEFRIGNENIDTIFLRRYPHLYRHSKLDSGYRKAKKELSKDPDHLRIINNPNEARSYYLSNLEKLINYFIYDNVIK